MQYILEKNGMVILDQIKWEEAITRWMIQGGWIKDKDDDTTLGFIIIDNNGKKFCRDYNKKTRRCQHTYDKNLDSENYFICL